MKICALLLKILISVSITRAQNFNYFDTENILHCLCANCSSTTTVGILYEKHCYYININDRIQHGNDLVGQFEPSFVHNDFNIADSIIVFLKNTFYKRFKYPYINMKVYSSILFYSTASKYDNCVKLDLNQNIFFDDESNGCLPEPAILRTDRFEELFQSNWKERNQNVSHKQCNTNSNGTLVSNGSKCLFYSPEQCSIAFINSLETYHVFEAYVVSTFERRAKHVCLEMINAKRNRCMLNLFQSEFNSYVIYMNTSFFKEDILSDSYFHINGNTTGYYVVDVNRRFLLHVSTYGKGMDMLLNKYKNSKLNNLCMEPDEIDYTFYVSTYSNLFTPKLPLTTDEGQLEYKTRHSANQLIFFITTAIVIASFIFAVLFKFRNIICSFWEEKG